MSRELRTRQIQFKIVNRVYWTPSRLFRVGLTESPECWRCQSRDGTLVHMLWSCPKVQEYWNDIHDRLQKITGLVIPFNPLLFILGDPATLEDIAPFLAEWIQTALMLGRRLLIRTGNPLLHLHHPTGSLLLADWPLSSGYPIGCWIRWTIMT